LEVAKRPIEPPGIPAQDDLQDHSQNKKTPISGEHMRKSLIGAGLAITAVFAVGFAVGQIAGINGSSAATIPPNNSNAIQRPQFRFLGPPRFAVAGGIARGFLRGAGLRATTATGPRADGKVTAVNGNTITVQPGKDNGNEPSGESKTVTTIQLNSSTTYDNGPGQSGSASSIKVGDFIIAMGTVSSDGTTLTASHVMIGGPGGGGCPGGGGAHPGHNWR
jgi:hypothetical protein